MILRFSAFPTIHHVGCSQLSAQKYGIEIRAGKPMILMLKPNFLKQDKPMISSNSFHYTIIFAWPCVCCGHGISTSIHYCVLRFGISCIPSSVTGIIAITAIDTSGLETLGELIKILEKRSLQFVLVNPIGNMMEKLYLSSIISILVNITYYAEITHNVSEV
ncbi:unnamed protein product [Vicia faba]|uniref:STAS domain-containing protein n=1 Tax=Vicia faba TaxID=3906 RepID=A0AAV1AMH5_VICFA|nr:unnamed protein product [Vicia faba]